jgi:small subunit ribosomal protein S21
LEVSVADNNVEKAIKILKKKLMQEGFYAEIRKRRFYDKPSVKRKIKMKKAAKRRMKSYSRFFE